MQNEFLSQSDEFSFSEAGLTISGRVLGEGPPLYFLNGISATPTLFCLAVWLLRDEFRCVILGYPPEAQTLTQLAQSLDLAATRFGDEQFDLYATSFGTSVALHAMQSFPQRIQHAVLQGPLISMKFSMAERLALATLGWLPGQIDCLPLRQTVLQNKPRTMVSTVRHYSLEISAGRNGQRPHSRRCPTNNDAPWTRPDQSDFQSRDSDARGQQRG